MSSTPISAPAGRPAGGTPGLPRVRHQAREALALMAFSAVTSVATATALMLLLGLGR